MTAPLKQPAIAIGAWLAQQPQALQTDCRHLLCARLHCDHAALLRSATTPLTAVQLAQLDADVAALNDAVPLAYLIGEQPFHDIVLQVDARVLVPRSDTETLVEAALALANDGNPALQVLELGTGSGAIALALAQALPTLMITATDNSADALAVAADNAQRLNLPIRCVQSHWFAAVSGAFDLIISNPPYIASNDPHLPALRHEPQAALVAGSDGLDDLRHIIRTAPAHLYHGGHLLVEHGFDQADAVAQLYTDAGFADTRTVHDLAGHPRVTVGQWRRP